MRRPALRWIILIALLWIIVLLESTSPTAVTESFSAIQQSPRKGSVMLILRDESGAPWTNATVEYTQGTHDFLFGVGMTSAQEGCIPPRVFQDLRTAGANYALPFVSWAGTEAIDGLYNWNDIEHCYRPHEMQQLGYTLNGHCMIFFYDQSWNLPQYVKSMDFEQLKQAISKHVFTLVAHYRGVMTYWDINEPTFSYSDFFKLSQAQWIEIVDTAAKAVRKADPNAKIMVNVPPVDDPAIRYSPHAILDALVNSGVDFDVIGVELYPFFAKILDPNGYPSIEWASAMLDSYARFGKRVILSEVGVKDVPSQEAQAEWLRTFYAMAFEKQFVLGITWYFVDDDPFLPGGGLFPSIDLPPRPIYDALTQVIQERTTKGVAETNSEGSVKIEGFAGNYLIQANDGLRSASFTIHIAEGEDLSITLTAPLFTTTATQKVLTTTSSRGEVMMAQPSSAILIGGTIAAVCAVGIVAALLHKRRSAAQALGKLTPRG